VYLNNLASTDQIISELTAHKTTFLAVYERDEDFANTVITNVPSLRRIININPSTPSAILEFTFLPYDAFLKHAKYFRGNIQSVLAKHLFSRQDAIFLQTSGSTSGRPKSLPFSDENVFAALIYAANSTGTKTNDQTVKKVLCALPYRLPYGWMTIFVNLLGGNLVELALGTTTEHIAEYWKTKASYIYGTPQMWQDFIDNTPDDVNLSFLEAFFVAGFSISEAQFQAGTEWLRRHNCSGELRNNYGIGEALCVGTASDGVPHRPNTCGKFYIGPKYLIVDDNLREVAYDEIGELLVHSKSLCNGYFNDPATTTDAFIQHHGKRFFRSGDYFSLSKDGYVTFVGRKKRFYQPQGAPDKVNCETIERAISDITLLVKECVVVIYSPDDKSESSCAFIVPQKGLTPNSDLRDQIFRRLNEGLLNYQLPSKILFLDDLPLMKSGKPNYTKLRELAEER
ncbi:MAG: fatty acid--CoA ligase family protein, partial [Candidatus Saccharibacteria bacterium]|nr:fatty acid--CoA ligase family protein [Candidatus Saccharibacteria bacterium]